MGQWEPQHVIKNITRKRFETTSERHLPPWGTAFTMCNKNYEPCDLSGDLCSCILIGIGTGALLHIAKAVLEGGRWRSGPKREIDRTQQDNTTTLRNKLTPMGHYRTWYLTDYVIWNPNYGIQLAIATLKGLWHVGELSLAKENRTRTTTSIVSYFALYALSLVFLIARRRI